MKRGIHGNTATDAITTDSFCKQVLSTTPTRNGDCSPIPRRFGWRLVRKIQAKFNGNKDSKELQALLTPDKFVSCAGRMYWVAIVLTGDRKKAEELILPAVDDIADSHTTFGEWLCTWTLRRVVRSCASLHRSELSEENGTCDRWRSKVIHHANVKLQLPTLTKERLQGALLGIPLLARFVFFLRVLEGYDMPEISRILDVDEDSCEASLSYAYVALPEALISEQEVPGTEDASAHFEERCHCAALTT